LQAGHQCRFCLVVYVAAYGCAQHSSSGPFDGCFRCLRPVCSNGLGVSLPLSGQSCSASPTATEYSVYAYPACVAQTALVILEERRKSSAWFSRMLIPWFSVIF